MARYSEVRVFTCKLLDAIKDGLLTNEQVVEMCLNYMSEDEVADMCHANDLFTEDAEDDC